MTPREKVNILLVDDQPAKLLSLETILADLDENILKAGSADEALKHLLAHEVAVVLVDVCMPKMDGFELAQLIRDHPRFKRTAIIFISAVHLTDDDRLKGYDLGAVDYISVPIIPAVLRAKVAIFAELHRKTDQLRALNRELEQRVAERTADLEASTARIIDSERRYRELVHALPAAVYTCDAQGRIVLYNQAAVELWGGEPRVGEDKWCGSWRIFRPDGSPLPLEDCPMALTLREGRAVRGQEIVIERPDGTRRNVMPYPEPIRDASGALIGAVNMLADLADLKAAERAHALLAAIVASSDDAIISKTLDGRITSWNAGAEAMLGYSAEEALNHSIFMLIPPDRRDEEREVLGRLCRGEHIQHFETVRVAKDGRRLDISLTISPLRDAAGMIVGASTVARDISERKRAEAVLARDRETLERLVAERTAELERAAERLRFTDRMATIGTLCAGLGHDMGNLLLPVRMRLEAIKRVELPAAAREDVAAIEKASQYLQRLAGSLRLLSLDPEAEAPAESATSLDDWWTETEGMIRNGVPRTVALTHDFAPGLPPVRIGKASLTQVIFNLVQNAGDALRGRPQGRVVVAAAAADEGSVVLSVADNGPGMSEEARRRCVEPFFTTKTRGLSTGLGLALVSGIVSRAGGAIAIDSEMGRGTEFRITLPAVVGDRAVVVDSVPRRVAVVTLQDRKLFAHVESVLTSLAFDVRPGRETAEADVWVTDTDGDEGLTAARSFAESGPVRCAVVFAGEAPGPEPGGRVVMLERRLKPSALRARLAGALGAGGAT